MSQIYALVQFCKFLSLYRNSGLLNSLFTTKGFQPFSNVFFSLLLKRRKQGNSLKRNLNIKAYKPNFSREYKFSLLQSIVRNSAALKCIFFISDIYGQSERSLFLSRVRTTFNRYNYSLHRLVFQPFSTPFSHFGPEVKKPQVYPYFCP